MLTVLYITSVSTLNTQTLLRVSADDVLLIPSPSGAAPWNITILFRPAGRHSLHSPAGGGLSAAHPSAGLGAGGLLPSGPTPPAGPVLHPLQPGCVQEPAHPTQSEARSGELL